MIFVWGLLGLSFLVFFHELGHFCAARLCGVTVESFSIGMGPVLLHHTWRGTDWRLSLIPLGGYCGMKGEKDYLKALEEDGAEVSGEPDSFYGVCPLKKLLIAFAGPFFNLLFAFFAYTAIALTGYTYYSSNTVVSMPDDVEEYRGVPSPAHEAGMQSGDRILTIDGKPMENFSDIGIYVATRGGQAVTVSVERGGTVLDIVVPVALDTDTGQGRIGIVSREDSYVERHYGPYPLFPALWQGVVQTGGLVTTTIRGIGILFRGVKVSRVVSGPVRITALLGERMQEGFSAGMRVGIVGTLEMLAFISVSLFLGNLLPVPVLDGGLIVFALIEWVSRRKIPPKVLSYIQSVGMALIGAVLVLVLVGDIRYLTGLQEVP